MSTVGIRITGDSRDLVAATDTASASLARLGASVAKVGTYALAGGALYATATAVGAVGKALFDASASAQRLTTQLNFATGGNSAKEMAFVAQMANRLGLEITSTAQAYAGFASASRGTAIEGQKARDVFESISAAAAVMGLSTDQASGALLAVQQMMSKGVVSAEEFRGQLGERMPIALAAGAKALNVTTAEFSKMLETGQIIAADFLPKFGAAIKEMIGGAAEEAAGRLDASVNRMGNAWTKLKQTIGDSGVAASIAGGIGFLTEDMNALSRAMDRAKNSGGGFWSQANAGLGQLIGRTIGLQLMNRDFMSLDAAVKDATATIQRLDAQERRDGKLSIFSMSERAEAARDLAKANRELAASNAENLGGGAGRGGINPDTVGQMAAADAKNEADLNAFRLKQTPGLGDYLASMQEIVRLNAAGVLVGDEFTKAIARQQAAFAKKTGTVQGSAKAVDAAVTAQQTFIETITQEAAMLGLSETAQKLYKAALLGIQGPRLEAIRTTLQGIDAFNASEEAQKAETKARLDALAAADGSIASAIKSIDALKDEAKALALSEQLNISVAEAVALVTVKRLEEALVVAQIANDTAMVDKLTEEIRLRRELAGLVGSKESAAANTKAAKDAAEEWKKASEKINDQLTDALMRAFESGKGFARSLRDTLVNMFKTTVLRPIIQGVLAPITGALGFAGSAQAGQGGGSALGAVSGIKSIYDTISGGFAALGDKVAFAAQDMGAWLVNNTSGVLNQAGSSLMTSANMLGTAASYLGGAAVGVMAGRAISNGYSLNGGSGNATVNIGTAVGAFFGGPIGAAIGGAIGGLINRTFGMGPRKVTGSGVEGTASAGGFGGDAYESWKRNGGLVRSDKSGTDRSPLQASQEKAFDQAIGGLYAGAAAYGQALGLPVDALKTYSASFKVAWGKTEAENEAAIAASLGSLADDLATQVAPDIARFKKDGETASATLGRLSVSLTITNGWMNVLKQRIFAVGFQGASAASALADAFGGLENFTAASQAFYELYFTEGEKLAKTQTDMASALAFVNLQTPTSKDAFRQLAGSLDLNTSSGRAAYAVLMALAPTFSATSEAVATLARDTAAKLLTTFTGGGALIPALEAARLKVSDLTGSTVTYSNEVAYMNRVMLDASSGVIELRTATFALDGSLTDSQASALLLNAQIDALALNADGARIDFEGLTTALADVNTETFVASVSLVFESLGARLNNVIGDIASERIALREAAIQIINPTVMSKAAIQRGINSINTSLPSNAGVVAANSALTSADASVSAAALAFKPFNDAVITLQERLATDTAALGRTEAALTTEAAWQGQLRLSLADLADNKNTSEKFRLIDEQTAQLNSSLAFTQRLTGELSTIQGYIAYVTSSLPAAIAARSQNQGQLDASTGNQGAAQDAAKQALLAYAGAMQDFVIDASKSVGKLTRLREETVKYYEAQSKLAGLMSASASGIRGTISAYQYGLKSDEAKLSELAGQFSTAFSMSKITTGETLAGYGDKINELLNPLLDLLVATGKENLIGSYLAQAEAVATSIDDGVLALGDFQADSLSLLGSIDATLAALDASSQSAEKIISDAVNAGADLTASGLRAIVSQLGGTPAFASGGFHSGGLRLVGENGPELESTGPSRIWSAGQTASMFGGGSNSDALIAEMRAVRASLEAGMAAVAINTGKTAKQLEQWDDGGAIVTTAMT